MKSRLLLGLFILISLKSFSQVKVTEYENLEKEFYVKGDSVVLVNFWATSCKPCIEEFPYFILAQEEYKNKKVKFIYVSLDFSSQKAKVESFVQKKGLLGKIFLLKDDPNVWINKIDQEWGGDIPYTLLIKPNGEFVGHDVKFISFDELKKFIEMSMSKSIPKRG